MRSNTLPSQIRRPKDPESGTLLREETVTIIDAESRNIHERPTMPTHRFGESEGEPTTERVTVRVLPIIPAIPPFSARTQPSLDAVRLPKKANAVGSLSDVPYLRMDPALLRTKTMPPETLFVLRLIDGRRDVEMILDSCPLEVPAVLEIVSGLLAERIIDVRR
jgi:hypothetical protein